jgi:hypothetical protein
MHEHGTNGTAGTVSTVKPKKTVTMRVRALRDQLGKRVDAAHYGDEFTIVTNINEPRAVLVPYAWFVAMAQPDEDRSDGH